MGKGEVVLVFKGRARMTRHKYTDLIIAWAEGATIQYKRSGLDFCYDGWQHEIVEENK